MTKSPRLRLTTSKRVHVSINSAQGHIRQTPSPFQINKKHQQQQREAIKGAFSSGTRITSRMSIDALTALSSATQQRLTEAALEVGHDEHVQLDDVSFGHETSMLTQEDVWTDDEDSDYNHKDGWVKSLHRYVLFTHLSHF